MDDNIKQINNFSEILVVEDDPICLMLLSKILSGAGYKVSLAENADIALKSIQKNLPALIFLDIIMPGMNGYELCKMLKADKYTALIPIIFCSGLTDKSDIAKGLAAGGIAYLTKPYNFPEILAMVNVHFKTEQTA